jgi:hypothetical protein
MFPVAVGESRLRPALLRSASFMQSIVQSISQSLVLLRQIPSGAKASCILRRELRQLGKRALGYRGNFDV